MILIIFLALFSTSSIYGIDLGSQNLRIAVSSPGKQIEIKRSERDQRFTPNYLAVSLTDSLTNLSDVAWLIGSDAERIQTRNSSHGIRNPFSFLASPSSFNFHGLPSVQVAATALYYHCRTLKIATEKIVLIVPTHSTPQHRFLLSLTAKLVGFKSVSVLDSATAVGTMFSVERLKKGSRKTMTALFVDIGAETAEVYLWKFRPLGEKLHMELLDYRHSTGIGGGYIDRLLFNWAAGQIARPLVGSEPYILLTQLRKAKEQLAAVRSIGVDLTEDYGKFLTIDQPLIRNITANMTAQLRELLSGIDVPDELELIGGGSRLHAFVEAVAAAFPGKTPRRTLNSDEACALGGAYFAALRAGTIIGSKIEIKKPAPFGLRALFDDNASVVYEPGEVVREKHLAMNGTLSRLVRNNVTVRAGASANASVGFDAVLIEGVEQGLRQIKDPLTADAPLTFKLKYGLSPDLDCADLVEASVVANVTVARRSLGLPGHGRTNVRLAKVSLLSLPADPAYQIPPDSGRFVRRMIAADEDQRRRQESCHKIEAFIVDARDKASFDSDMRRVTTAQERKEMVEQLNVARAQIDCTNLSSLNETARELDLRLDRLQKRFEKPIERYEERQKRPAALRKLKITISRAYESRPKALCDEQTLRQFDDYLNETITLISGLDRDGPLDQPSFLTKDMKDRESEILKKIAEVLRPPKKSEVINYSSDRDDEYDEDERERLRNVGIMVPQKNSKSNPNKDVDPVVRAEKEAKLAALKAEYKAGFNVFNETKRVFCDHRAAYERKHHLTSDACQFPSDDVARRQFKEEEEYDARLQRRAARRAEKAERERQADAQPDAARALSPEEAAAAAAADARRAELERERQAFRASGSGMFDDAELTRQDDEALWARYKELKRLLKDVPRKPFENADEREKYETQRREYDQLRKRFAGDARHDVEKKRKQAEKRRKDAKAAKAATKTKLDDGIEDAEADLRRLARDRRRLQEDIEDFEKLRAQIDRRDAHETRRARRRQKRELIERKRRREEWDALGDGSGAPAGDTIENLEKQLRELEDVELEEDSSWSEENRPVVDPDKDLESDDVIEISSSSSSQPSSESTKEFERRKTREGEIQEARDLRQAVRRKIDPALDGPKRKKGERDPLATVGLAEVYKRRFTVSKESGSSRRSKHDAASPNRDDDLREEEREIQEEEIEEEGL